MDLRTAPPPSANMAMIVLAVAVPVGKRSFSTSTIWRRKGTAKNTPSQATETVHRYRSIQPSS